MIPNDDPLEAHGGIESNNLSSILNIEDDTTEEGEQQLNFSLTEYFDLDNFTTYSKRNVNSLNILSLNTESICSKIDTIKLQLGELKRQHNFTVHIAAFQECWINTEDQINQLEIEDYQIFHELNKIGGHKGGLVMYVHNSITAEKIASINTSPSELWEELTVKISPDCLNKPLLIRNIYRPPREKAGKRSTQQARENHDKFIEEFEPYLDKIKKTY